MLTCSSVHDFTELMLYLLDVLQDMRLISLDNVHKAPDFRCMRLCMLANKPFSVVLLHDIMLQGFTRPGTLSNACAVLIPLLSLFFSHVITTVSS